MSVKRRDAAWLAWLCFVLAAPAAAEEFRQGDFQLHGFLTQGWAISEGNNIYGDSTNGGGTLEFRELGINASWRPFGPVLIAAQTAAIEQGQAVDEDVVFEYGLVDVTALQGTAGRLGLRAGKLKLPIGLYNESRDAVFTRPGITLPESVYLENSGARAFGYFAAEGVGTYADWYLGDHAVYVEVLGAWGQELDDRANIAILRSPVMGSFDVDQGVVARLLDEYDGGRVKVALSLLSSDLSYTPEGDPLFNQPADFNFDQAVLSLQYNAEKWSVTSEAVLRRIELSDASTVPFPVAPFSGTLKQDPGGYYLQGTYRLTPAWQVLMRFDEQIRDVHDRHGYEQARNSATLSAASGGLIPAQPRYYHFARDLTAGTRYDVLPNVSVLAEFHYVDGAGWVNPLDNPSYASGGADRYWNFLTVMLGVRF